MSTFMPFTEWMTLREGQGDFRNTGVPHYAAKDTPPIATPMPNDVDRAELRSLGWKRRARDRFCRHMGVASFKELVGMRVKTKNGTGVITSSRLESFSVQSDQDGRKKVLAYSSAPYEGIEPLQPEQPVPAIN